MDVYKEIRRLQLEGITSQRAAAKQLGISRNTVKKYWEGNTVPWDRKTYSREAVIMTPEVVQFITACLDEDEREKLKKQRHTARRIYQRLVEELLYMKTRKRERYGEVTKALVCHGSIGTQTGFS